VTNVDENDFIEGKLLGYFSFGALVKELMLPCGISSLELQLGFLLFWPIKKWVYFNIGSFLKVEFINKFKGLME
jgi:hypothetical protein